MDGYRDYDCISVFRRGARVDLVLNRPDRRNALTHRMMDEIGDAARRVGDDDGARVLLLRGAGGHFCAGGDLDAMAEMPPPPGPGEVDPLIRPYRIYGDVLIALNDLPKPVVALVEGACAGGGLGMACCADLTICLQSARFGMPEPRVGFIPSQIIPYVVRRIGEGAARRLAVTGLRFDGHEAARLGIAHFCVADEAAMIARAIAELTEIAACEPAAVRAVKGLVLESAYLPDESVMDHAAERLVELLRRPSALDGIEAFMLKDRPAWADPDPLIQPPFGTIG